MYAILLYERESIGMTARPQDGGGTGWRRRAEVALSRRRQFERWRRRRATQLLLRTLRRTLPAARVAAFAPTALRAADALVGEPLLAARALEPAAGLPAAPAPAPPPPAAPGLFDGLLMAVQKKRVSYMRKRIRQHGRWVARGPHLKTTMNMCAVCERMRLPHRVCDREDCKTYFKSRWE